MPILILVSTQEADIIPKRPRKVTIEEDQVARASVLRFNTERRRNLILRACGYVACAIIGLILLMMVSGSTFNPVLALFGLEAFTFEEGGIYADCSKSANRNNPFCSGKHDYPQSKDWNDLRSSSGLKGMPFSLSGK